MISHQFLSSDLHVSLGPTVFCEFCWGFFVLSLESERCAHELGSRSADQLCPKNARILTLTTSAHLIVAVVSMSARSVRGEEIQVFSPVRMTRAATIPVGAWEAGDLMGETPRRQEARDAEPAEQTSDQKSRGYRGENKCHLCPCDCLSGSIRLSPNLRTQSSTVIFHNSDGFIKDMSFINFVIFSTCLYLSVFSCFVLVWHPLEHGFINNVAFARVSAVCSTESKYPSGDPDISSVKILDLHTDSHAKHYFMNDS